MTAEPECQTIDAAWQAALEQIRDAGIDLRRAPLFLTLGQPSGGLREFCSVLPLDSPLPLPAATDGELMRVYGNQQGLFVCCGPSSLFGDSLQSAQFPEHRSDSFSQPRSAGADPEGLAATLPRTSELRTSEPRPSGFAANPLSAAGPLRTTESSGGTATLVRCQTAPAACHSSTETSRAVEVQLDELERQLALADAVFEPQPAALLNRSTAAVAGQHLAQLCRLISEAREPYCPLNGVVILLPFELLGSDASTEQAADCIQRDLQIAMRSLETEVSVQAIVCGLAACEGGDELLDRLSQEQLSGTFGCVFPVPPKGDRESARRSIDQAAAWLCDGLFPALARRVLRRDEADGARDGAAQEGNRRLHHLVATLRSRRQRLSRLLSGCLSATPGQWRIRGCYFAPTPSSSSSHSGSSLAERQAFAAGILAQIHAIQNEVRWFDSRRRRDTCALAATLVGYALLTAATLATAAIVLD